MYNFVEVSGHNLDITNQFQTIFTLLVEVTVNSKEENSEDFCSNYVQEFGLWELALSWRAGLAQRPAYIAWLGEGCPAGVICTVIDCLYHLPWQRLLSCELIAFPAAVI